MIDNKPPLGIRPRSIAEWQRALEITDGMKRYSDAGIPVPKEWIDELAELIWRLNSRRGGVPL